MANETGANATGAPFDRDTIHFETIWSAARTRVEAICKDRWTDLAEHDPGVTLLQALAYGASDLAYRHTLPIVDLLTPKDAKEGSIFPGSFSGPIALSTSPITPDDFRRALLDLADWSEGGRFLLRDAQLVELRDEAAPSFFYDAVNRSYTHKNEKSDLSPIRLAGGYALYLVPERDINLEKARTVVDEWLQQNRNLCEFIVNTVWLAPFDIELRVEVELHDDWTDAATAIVAVARACDASVGPRATRMDRRALLATGLSPYQAFDGPQTEHGWIVQLPPLRDYTLSSIIDLDLLEHRLRAVPGVRRVLSISVPAEKDSNSADGRKIDVPARHFPNLWPGNALKINRVVATKRGQRIPPTRPGLVSSDLLQTRAPEPEELAALPYGRYRRLDDYASASALLPAVYGLHDVPPSQSAHHLHQFLLPFEHQLAGGCDQLDRLSRLLSFDTDRDVDAPVWGTKWPFGSTASLDDVAPEHGGYAEKLEAVSLTQSKSPEKTFELINYLLGYFGIAGADRTLLIEQGEFLATQVGLLKQAAELGRQRTSFPADRVSAIQQRLAARLGWGASLFDAKLALENYPFYIVEHVGLLPPDPDEKYDEWSAIEGSGVEVFEGRRQLLVGVTSVEGIALGQMIDLQFGDQILVALMTVRIKDRVSAICIDIDSNRHLKIALEALLQAGKKAQWRNADVWLRAMDYQPAYVEQPAEDDSPIATLKIRPFPIGVWENVEFEIQARETEDPSEPSLKGKIHSIDPVQGTVTASLTNESWPKSIGSYSLRLSAKATAIDYFSFAATVVFNRDDFTDFADVVDPHSLVGWLSEAIEQEFPLNVNARVLWMTSSEFQSFRLAYGDWKRSGGVVGDRAYALLEMLSLGRTPVDTATGIGAMRISSADDVKREELLGADSTYEQHSAVRESGFLYIPKPADARPEED